MNIYLALATVVGAALFPFIIRLVWGHFTDEFGTFGGFLSALFIVGVMWALNHGYAHVNGGGLIYQTGVWVDMGTAAGVGLLVASILQGPKFDKHTKTNILGALLGGLIAGLIIAFTMHTW